MITAPQGIPTPSAFALCQACQIAVGAVLSIPAGGWPNWKAFCAPFADIPAPKTYGDALHSSLVLFRFLERAGEEIHARVHQNGRRENCPFAPSRHSRISGVDQRRPASWSGATTVTIWANAYERDLATHHGRQIASRALERVNGTLAAVKASDVARDVGCSVPALYKEFARATGQSLRQYVIRVRVARAIDLLRSTDWKIEAISDEVGWRSKKNLHEAFGRLVGTTPQRLRGLNDDALEAVRQRLLAPR